MFDLSRQAMALKGDDHWHLARWRSIFESSLRNVKPRILTALLMVVPVVVCAGPQLVGNVSAYNWDGTGLDFQLGQSTSTSDLQFSHRDAESNEFFFTQAQTWANATQVGNLYTNAIYTQDSGFDVRDYEGGYAGASSSWSDSLLLLSPPSSVEQNNVILSVKMAGFLGSGTSLFFKVFSPSSPTPITAYCAKENAGSCSFEASMTVQQAEYVNIFEELSSSIVCNPGYSAGCGGEAGGSVSFMSVDLLDAATRQPLQYVTSGGETLPSLAIASVPEARTDLLALVGLCLIAFAVRKKKLVSAMIKRDKTSWPFRLPPHRLENEPCALGFDKTFEPKILFSRAMHGEMKCERR